MWCPGWDAETARGHWVKTKEFWIKYGLWLRIMGHSQFISCDRWTMVMLLLLLFSHPVMSDSLWSHGLQHARHPCPSWSPEACSNSCPPRQWCHPIISSSVVPFSSCLQPSKGPASGPFLISQLFASGGQSIGVSASASVLPMNIQNLFPLGWTGWISLQSKGLSQESFPTPELKSINSLVLSFLYGPTLTSIHDHWKNHSFD